MSFDELSKEWLREGWDKKYTYTFTWLGRPIIQLPEDMIRIQEVIYRLKPDVIVETGIAHGGSLIFYASLCEMMNRGRIIGIDIDIRPHNRRAIEEHELFHRITLVEGDSVAPETVAEVWSHVGSFCAILVILDSCHTKNHVLAELEAYCDLVTSGSYIVVADGIMEDLKPEWADDNPRAAVREFLKTHVEFTVEQPPWAFNESDLTQNITNWPEGYLKCCR